MLKLKKINNNQINFLHIGKNAGTQIEHVAQKLKHHGVNIQIKKHRINLNNLSVGSKYFFSIREPSLRFFSGFYSRKRKGLPKYNSEWSEGERICFEQFEDANQLAENLLNNDENGIAARIAIKTITHTGKQQFDWFYKAANFQIYPPITIIRTEHFEKDMQRLLNILGVKLEISDLLANDNINAHRNNYDDIKPLSGLALGNLKKWYIQDYFFYDMCEEWLKKNI